MLLHTESEAAVPPEIGRDQSTQLPLLSEVDELRRVILAHLALPYSVAEYGCGKKANIIIELLVRHGVPAWAIGRGLALEADMSPAALAEEDAARRPHALTAKNPLYELGDLRNQRLRDILTTDFAQIVVEEDDEVHAGPFVLHHQPIVQFAIARSHVFTLLRFWDDEQMAVAERVVDLTLDPDRLFGTTRIRELLRAPDCLIFRAPMLGRFRLRDSYLTEAQRQAVRRQLNGRSLDELDTSAHSALVRELTGAEPGSIGDPETWTYANNIPTGDHEQDAARQAETGLGDSLRALTDDLLASRFDRRKETSERYDKVVMLVQRLGVHESIRRDATWSSAQLEPLANVAIGMQYAEALEHVAGVLLDGEEPARYLTDPSGERPLHGLGVRLRRRLDVLAELSEDDKGRIDARALTERYRLAALETARQMDEAGLHVCVDRVGNLHGLSISREERDAIRDGHLDIAEVLESAIAFVSHIDTVMDAGKFDGRLGVLAGVEISQVIHDLKQYYDLDFGAPESRVRLIVCAFCNEEMTFAGRGVSMPGSAAVAGFADPVAVDDMTDLDGRRYRDEFLEMLRLFRDETRRGGLVLVNDLDHDEDDALLGACFDPRLFFTPHTYERHIEQGPVLDRREVPLALVERIMGIRQEDVAFEGFDAEAAALEFNLRLRELAGSAGSEHTRVTVGVLDAGGEITHHPRPDFGVRLALQGEINHAGATSMTDRRDPGVALARVAREVSAWLHRAGRTGRTHVGELALHPGANRNVIPGAAVATLAVLESDMTADDQRDLMYHLNAFAFGALVRPVEQGGEGLIGLRLEPSSVLLTASRVTLSFDLRDPDQAAIDRFLSAMEEALAEIERKFSVTSSRRLAQSTAPRSLAETGQALLMERSYGGSHNPLETELTGDLVRATALQLAVTHRLLNRETLDLVNLFEQTDALIPKRWKDRLPRYVSGALHDTCNIAARVADRAGGPQDQERKSKPSMSLRFRATNAE
jgi:acetylornithine deacetylase/succinyl-diaminopimelate desuccinylase-like protein